MHLVTGFVDIMLHLDKYLGMLISHYGVATYLILFLIIFLETGLVVTPLLPGDSLIFAAATFAARGFLDITLLIVILIIAAILGDTMNYEIGKHLGKKVLAKKNSRIIKKEYIEKTNSYYDKYGGKTIIIARFIPIVRTFAPFVAGIGKMNYKEFIKFNSIGAFVWVIVVALLGYFFGNIPIVANNFSLVLIGVVIISILPAIVGILKAKLNKS